MAGIAPVELAKFLSENGYHPRSSKHGEVMCDFLLKDLYANCRQFRSMADNGAISYQTNYVVNRNTPTQWNIDLVIGKSRGNQLLGEHAVAKADPLEIWIALDAKAIMTEHGKTRRNRQRDLNSMAEILHRMKPMPITGAYVVVNMSSRFRSPLREEVTEHRNIERIVEETIPLFQDILRDRQKDRAGLDAIGITVIDYPNLPGSECKIAEKRPAPSSGSPLHYDSFLSRICSEFNARFPSSPQS